MKKSIILVVLVGFISIIVLSQTIFTQKSKNTKPITIAVSKTPLSAPFFIAEEKGFFKQVGLNVLITEVHGGPKSFATMIAGEADYATSSDSVMMFQAFKRDDFSCLATFVQSRNDIKLISNSNLNITKASDFIGRKVAVIKESASDYFFFTYLMLAGVDISKVEIIAMKPQEMYKALLNKEVDAVSTWEPYAYKIKTALKQQVNILPTSKLYTLTFNLFAKNNYIANNEKNNKKLITALSLAIEYLNKNTIEAQQIIHQRLELDQFFIDWIWDDYLFALSLKSSLLSTLNSEANWAIKNKIVSSEQKPEFLKYIDSKAFKSQFPNATSF